LLYSHYRSWKAWKIDAYGFQTAALERFSIPAMMRSLLEPPAQYGNLPIVILTSSLGVNEGNALYADLLRRTTNGRMRIVPRNINGPLIDKPRNPSWKRCRLSGTDQIDAPGDES
jgi:hypothetical protein